MNSAVLEYLEEIKTLLELRGENPFKIRAYDRAIATLASCTDLEARAKNHTLTELPGIGAGIAQVLEEFLLHGSTHSRDELKRSLPDGLLELTQVPGLGPKKAIQLIEELGIKSLSELEYACKENRLLKLKGFGEKVQTKILDGVRFLISSQGKMRLADLLPLLDEVKSLTPVGQVRRKLEVVDQIEFLVSRADDETDNETAAKKKIAQWTKKHAHLPPVHLHLSDEKHWAYDLVEHTATPECWQALKVPRRFTARTEAEFYQELKLPVLPPEVLEDADAVHLARQNLKPWAEFQSVRGIFHNHTTYSDGLATLDEMVSEAERLGYEYIGISDHSQSAHYAQGLNASALEKQEKEIRAVQKKHPKIRVFWGIESDILADGSLDYPEKILKRFDFVIASIHARHGSNREEMTTRILRAIENPYTTMIGHITGRLLLGRPAYEIDLETLIQRAAEKKVIIEINSHPSRLDLDWRWGKSLRKHGTQVCINPDAHEISGLQDTAYGITVARKALLPPTQILNTRSASEIESWLQSRKI